MSESEEDGQVDSTDLHKKSQPKSTSAHTRATAMRMEASFSWSAPLPPPDLLKQYNEVFPGCAERIVAMAESQSSHRQQVEGKVVGGNVSSQKTGLWLGFVLALIVILSGTWLVYTGHLAWGAAFTGFPLVSLVSVFVFGKRQQIRQLESHQGNIQMPSQRDLPFPEQ